MGSWRPCTIIEPQCTIIAMCLRPLFPFTLFLMASVVMEGQQADTAIAGVNVVDVVTGKVIADQTVLVSSGRIAAMGAAESMNIPREAKRVDAKGY